MGKNISHLKIGSETYDLKPYAVCTTDAGSEMKSVTIDGFSIYDGAEITILFKNGNTFWDNFGLCINDGDEIYVVINENGYHGGKIFPPNTTHTFRYDGQCWEMISYNGLYPTIPCDVGLLRALESEDMLVVGQTYSVLYRAVVASDYGINNFGNVANNYMWNIILTATSSNKLDYEAKLGEYGGRSVDFSNWKVWFSIYPDFEKGAWYAEEQAKYIYDSYGETWMTDGYWKELDDRRYLPVHHTSDGRFRALLELKYGASFYTVGFDDGGYFEVDDEYQTVDEYHRFDSYSSTANGFIFKMIDENGNEAPFDFHNIKVKCTAQNSLNDGINYAINVNGKNNIIKTTAQYSGGGLTYASLPNVYVYGNDNFIDRETYNIKAVGNNNHVSYGAYNIVFGGCNFNEFGYESHDITLGSSCTHNKFGNRSYSITFGSSCAHNNIENYSRYIKFGNGSSYNSVGMNCNGNELGNYSYYNTFMNSTNGNKLGGNAYYNIFKNHASYNELGAYSYYNTFGQGVQYCSIRTSASYSGTLRTYCYNNIFENGVTRVVLYNTNSNSSSTKVQNICVNQGCTFSGYTYAGVGVNYAIKCNVINATSSTVTI